MPRVAAVATRSGPARSAQRSSVELMLQVRVGGPVLLDNLGRRLVGLSQPELALHLLEQRRAKAQREPCDDRFHEELHLAIVASRAPVAWCRPPRRRGTRRIG